MKHIISYIAGVIFSSGLILSDMINPETVLGFLDILGDWDARLLFVMCGAVAVTFVGFRLILKRNKPLFEADFSIPDRTELDASLVLGAIIFGVGWGLVGLCPGPAIAAFSAAPEKTLIFTLAMISGMYMPRMLLARTQ